MTEPLVVRRITADSGDDAAALFTLLDEVVEIQREAFGFSDAQLVPAYGLDMTGWTFGAWHGESLIGFALCCLNTDKSGTRLELVLQQAGVRNAFRRHGFGTLMMHAIAAEAKRVRLPITRIKWCQDPMLARVAGFYISPSVPGRGVKIIRNRYGALTGNYTGLPTHRLEVELDLVEGRVPPPFDFTPATPAFDPSTITLDAKPEPRWCELNGGRGDSAFLVQIPSDFEAMKRSKPAQVASDWQSAVISVMHHLCLTGFRAVNFRPSPGRAELGEYLFIRAS